MAATSSTARKRATARRRKPARHPASRVKIPKGGPLHARVATWAVLRIGVKMAEHRDVIRSRKDAAILRLSHEGCQKCGGKGQIHTKGKDGAFTGSKPCPVAPAKQKVSTWAVRKAARFGPDKDAGLIGWTCPCGKQVKPRFRDPKEATKALRTHERQKHGGKTVGGSWTVKDTTAPSVPAQKKAAAPVSKVVANSGKTDKQWISQNSGMDPSKAEAKGLCWTCGGNGKLHGAHGGEQTVTVCPECSGTGKAKAAA